MKIVIAGGGNIGYYLTKTLTESKYDISVIEINRHRCDLIDDSSFGKKVQIICGDATDENILRDAGTEDCDVFIAATGQDQNNLTACMLAKDRFKAAKTICRVNNPKNIRVFQKLGVNSVISSADRIANVIEQELDWEDLDSILAHKTKNARIKQFIIDPEAKAVGMDLIKLPLPKGTIIVMIVRGDEAIIPGGTTKLEAGDELMVMGPKDDLVAAENLFYQRVNN